MKPRPREYFGLEQRQFWQCFRLFSFFGGRVEVFRPRAAPNFSKKTSKFALSIKKKRYGIHRFACASATLADFAQWCGTTQTRSKPSTHAPEHRMALVGRQQLPQTTYYLLPTTYCVQVILCARAEYFRKMFYGATATGGMAEANGGQVLESVASSK